MISTRQAEAAVTPIGSGHETVRDGLVPGLPRLLAAILNDERRTLGLGTTPISDPDPDLPVSEDGFGFDSLARLTVVARLNRFFGLAETGIEDYLLVRQTFGDWIGLITRHFEMVGEGASITFSTSGSTQAPRHVRHSLADLVSEAGVHARMFFPDTVPTGRVLAAVPPFHIYGFLFTCLLPSLAGRDVVDLTSLGPGAPARLAKEGDLVIGTPTSWESAFASGKAFGAHVRGVTSGAAAGPSVWTAATSSGLADLFEIYGATETGGLGFRQDPEAPFQLLDHLERGSDGVCRKSAPDVPLPLQDGVAWLEDRAFRLAGRLDGVVQVGGVNVSPTGVAAWLEAQPGVSAASVRLGRGRLKAFIVPATGCDTTELDARLRAAMGVSLSAPERPVSLTFGMAIPRNAMGKPKDWEAT